MTWMPKSAQGTKQCTGCSLLTLCKLTPHLPPPPAAMSHLPHAHTHGTCRVRAELQPLQLQVSQQRQLRQRITRRHRQRGQQQALCLEAQVGEAGEGGGGQRSGGAPGAGRGQGPAGGAGERRVSR